MTGNGGIRPAGRRRRALALLGLLCALLLPGQASALSGSILLDCHVQAGGETLPLSGDTFAIVQIADITVEGQGDTANLTYQTRADFIGFACDWSALTGSDRQEKALQLEAYAKEKKLFTAAKTTDAKGQAAFTGLSTGLYLVSRIQAAPANGGYLTQPILVDIPTLLSGKWYYALNVVPKWEQSTHPDPGPDPSPDPTPGGSSGSDPSGPIPTPDKPDNNTGMPFAGDTGIALWVVSLIFALSAITGFCYKKKEHK